MKDNIFLKDRDWYTRQIDPVSDYIRQTSHYLHVQTGKDLATCERWIRDKLKNKEIPGLRNPTVHYFERRDSGDKYHETTTLTGYLNTVRKHELILAPTGTAYLPPSVKESRLSKKVKSKVKNRAIYKKAAATAKANRDFIRAEIENNRQENAKRSNNSLSGSFSTTGSPFNNPTGHSSLTSTVRTESSLANSSNEKMLSGNRHYYTPDIALWNMIAITSTINHDVFDQALDIYEMYIPTPDDVMQCIYRSSRLYWKDVKDSKLSSYATAMSATERAAFVYMNDLYHIREYNPELTKRLLDTLSTRVQGVIYEDPLSVIVNADEVTVNLAQQICEAETRGNGKKYHEFTHEMLCTLAGTIDNIDTTIAAYRTFVEAFFLTNNVCASTAVIATVMRRSVMLSDTDSTMYHVSNFIEWRYGAAVFTPEANALASTVSYLADQVIAHNLAMFSANLGVDRSELFTISMKPEFRFPVFARTSVAKHYFTMKDVKEGMVFSEPEPEVKGVHLISSTAPKVIMKDARDRMMNILHTVHSNQPIHLRKEIEHLIGIEETVESGITNGNTSYFSTDAVKNPESYTHGADCPSYQRHLMWTEVFEAKYGAPPQLPYRCIKFPTTLTNKTKMLQWIAEIEDRHLAERLNTWCIKYKKTKLPTIYIAYDYVTANGIPQELRPVINIRKTTLDVTKTHRMVLETLSYYPKNDMLLKEQY